MALLLLSLRAWAVAETLAEEEEEAVCCVAAGMAEVGKGQNRDWIIISRLNFQELLRRMEARTCLKETCFAKQAGILFSVSVFLRSALRPRRLMSPVEMGRISDEILIGALLLL